MLDLDRRRALALGALIPLAAALPAWAQSPGAGPGGEPASEAAWDLTDLYPSLAAWDAARVATLAAIPGVAQYKGRLGESAETLTAALIQSSDIAKTASRVNIYASLIGDSDLRNAQAQERQSLARDLFSKLGEATSWQDPELLALGLPKVEALIAASPVLQRRFAFGLRDTFRTAEHSLDAKGELLLAGAGKPLSDPVSIRNQLLASDIAWPTVTLSDGHTQRLDDQGYTLVRDVPNREDRKKVFATFWGAYGQFRNSLGATYKAKLDGDVFRMKARNYPTSVAAALSGDNIPETVYRTLVAETNAGLPQLHRYFELRRRILGLPDMAYYDIYPPLVSLGRTFTLAEMRATTLAAVAPLGRDYVARLAQATAGKWMDPRPRPGKASGAYMNGGAYDVHPYLLLNLSDGYDGMSTYAHEWGHAMHTLLAKQAQPFELSGYPTFTAEIASTCNEVLLADYMLARAKTKQEKLFYLGQKMENIRGTFFRQAMFAEFELKTHDLAEAGEGLSGRRFNEVYLDLLNRYHGPKVAIDPAYAIEWAYIGHFYRNFYVYQYATSISAGTYFARDIQRRGVKAADNYLSVLRAGGSDYPVDILKRAGLDMTTPAPYRALVASFTETLDAAEALL